MQQLGGSIAPRVAGLSHRPRPADRRSSSSGTRMVALGGRTRLGRVAAEHVPARARHKYRRLRGAAAAIAASETSTHASSNKPLTIFTEDKFFEIEMKVCDDELDEFGVVNNAIYASYLHTSRDILLEEVGIGVDYWTSTGNAMALSELNLKYFAPLRGGDRFVVKVKPVQLKGVRMVMHHVIQSLPDRKLVLEGRATVVCLNRDYRPTRVFPEVAERAWEVFSCKAT